MADLKTLESQGVGQHDTQRPAPEGTPPPAKPAEKPAAPAPAPKAPDKKPDVAPSKPTTPPAKPAAAPQNLDWKTAPVQFREAHTKLLQVHEAFKAEVDGKIAAIESEKSELLKRRYWTPEEEQRFKGLSEHAQKLEAQVYSMDYKLSPEFKAKYETRQKKVVDDLKANLADLKIKAEDGTERGASLADFKKIMAGATLVDQRRLAKQIFGDDGDIMLKFATDLRTIETEASAEIEQRSLSYTTDREKNMRNSSDEMEKSRGHFQSTDTLLAQKYPGVMAEDPNNPEFTSAFKQGLDYIDGLSKTFSTQTVQQRSFNTALTRRMAAGFFGARVLLSQKDAEIAKLGETIKQLQGSDPGTGGEGGGGTQEGTNKGGGSDSLANEIDSLV